ncbi:hypothetical protein D3C81_2101670 [compost metagenome]
MLRGDDETALRQALLAANLQFDAGEQGHGLDHAADIAADDPGGRATAGRQGCKRRDQAIADAQDPVGDIEGEASHPVVMTRAGGGSATA